MKPDILSCAIIAFIAYAFLRAIICIAAVKRDGIEAMACVSRVEERSIPDDEGVPTTYRDVYVRFQDRDGRQVEAELSNPDNRLCPGDWVAIKYLPDNPESVVLVKRAQNP